MIEFTDNQNGTITATTTNSAPGAVHDVFLQSLKPKQEDWQFVSQGTIAGNGNLIINHVGAYLAYSSSGGVAQPVTFGVSTTGQESTHYQCLIAVQARLRMINLPEIDDQNILVRKLPVSRQSPFEFNGSTCIMVSPPGVEGQSDSAGTNARDDIAYPVVVTILKKNNQDLIEGLTTELNWRQRINKAFRQQHLPGVNCVYRVRITPGPIVDQRAFWDGKYHSSFVIQCVSREGRGI